MSAYGFEDDHGTVDVASMIRSIVADPGWRGTGAGVVTLGLAHVPFSTENRPSVYMGNCAAADAKFYQRLGYTVLQPGEAFAAPFMGGAEIAIGSEQYPCLFFKEER